MAGPTKADYEKTLEAIFEIADAAFTPKATRSDLVEAIEQIYDLSNSEEDDEDDDSDDSEGDDDDE
jgi:hypothetical protein